jgi:hypothetical protein
MGVPAPPGMGRYYAARGAAGTSAAAGVESSTKRRWPAQASDMPGGQTRATRQGLTSGDIIAKMGAWRRATRRNRMD